MDEEKIAQALVNPEFASLVAEKFLSSASDSVEDDGLSLNNRGYYFLFDDIYSSSVLPVIEWILENNIRKTNRSEFLTLCINSHGGDMTSGFALIDVMRGSSIPIHTVGLGIIGSAALSIFMAGKKGKRLLTPNTSILSHQYSWGSFGKEHELFAVQKEYDLTTERMLNHYRKCTGIDDDEIRKFLLPPHDVWLSSNEALKYGICDEVKEMS
jgi:ATP-dependent Clp protease protease subunit